MQEKLSKKPIIWILGGPGSGKGTQCAMIVAKYGFTHISTGDLLRESIKSSSPSAQEWSKTIAKGELIDDNVVLDLLKEAIMKEIDTAKGFLIDGYPRKENQSNDFIQHIGPVTTILYLDTTNDTMLKRLTHRARTSERIDDKEETVQSRIQTFNENNNSILQAHKNLVVKIDANRDPDTIFADIKKELDTILLKPEVEE